MSIAIDTSDPQAAAAFRAAEAARQRAAAQQRAAAERQRSAVQKSQAKNANKKAGKQAAGPAPLPARVNPLPGRFNPDITGALRATTQAATQCLNEWAAEQSRLDAMKADAAESDREDRRLGNSLTGSAAGSQGSFAINADVRDKTHTEAARAIDKQHTQVDIAKAKAAGHTELLPGLNKQLEQKTSALKHATALRVTAAGKAAKHQAKVQTNAAKATSEKPNSTAADPNYAASAAQAMLANGPEHKVTSSDDPAHTKNDASAAPTNITNKVSKPAPQPISNAQIFGAADALRARAQQNKDAAIGAEDAASEAQRDLSTASRNMAPPAKNLPGETASGQQARFKAYAAQQKLTGKEHARYRADGSLAAAQKSLADAVLSGKSGPQIQHARDLVAKEAKARKKAHLAADFAANEAKRLKLVDDAEERVRQLKQKVNAEPAATRSGSAAQDELTQAQHELKDIRQAEAHVNNFIHAMKAMHDDEKKSASKHITFQQFQALYKDWQKQERIFISNRNALGSAGATASLGKAQMRQLFNQFQGLKAQQMLNSAEAHHIPKLQAQAVAAFSQAQTDYQLDDNLIFGLKQSRDLEQLAIEAEHQAAPVIEFERPDPNAFYTKSTFSELTDGLTIPTGSGMNLKLPLNYNPLQGIRPLGMAGGNPHDVFEPTGNDSWKVKPGTAPLVGGVQVRDIEVSADGHGGFQVAYTINGRAMKSRMSDPDSRLWSAASKQVENTEQISNRNADVLLRSQLTTGAHLRTEMPKPPAHAKSGGAAGMDTAKGDALARDLVKAEAAVALNPEDHAVAEHLAKLQTDYGDVLGQEQNADLPAALAAQTAARAKWAPLVDHGVPANHVDDVMQAENQRVQVDQGGKMFSYQAQRSAFDHDHPIELGNYSEQLRRNYEKNAVELGKLEIQKWEIEHPDSKATLHSKADALDFVKRNGGMDDKAAQRIVDNMAKGGETDWKLGLQVEASPVIFGNSAGIGSDTIFRVQGHAQVDPMYTRGDVLGSSGAMLAGSQSMKASASGLNTDGRGSFVIGGATQLGYTQLLDSSGATFTDENDYRHNTKTMDAVGFHYSTMFAGGQSNGAVSKFSAGDSAIESGYARFSRLHPFVEPAVNGTLLVASVGLEMSGVGAGAGLAIQAGLYAEQAAMWAARVLQVERLAQAAKDALEFARASSTAFRLAQGGKATIQLGNVGAAVWGTSHVAYNRYDAFKHHRSQTDSAGLQEWGTLGAMLLTFGQAKFSGSAARLLDRSASNPSLLRQATAHALAYTPTAANAMPLAYGGYETYRQWSEMSGKEKNASAFSMVTNLAGMSMGLRHPARMTREMQLTHAPAESDNLLGSSSASLDPSTLLGLTSLSEEGEAAPSVPLGERPAAGDERAGDASAMKSDDAEDAEHVSQPPADDSSSVHLQAPWEETARPLIPRPRTAGDDGLLDPAAAVEHHLMSSALHAALKGNTDTAHALLDEIPQSSKKDAERQLDADATYLNKVAEKKAVQRRREINAAADLKGDAEYYGPRSVPHRVLDALRNFRPGEAPLSERQLLVDFSSGQRDYLPFELLLATKDPERRQQLEEAASIRNGAPSSSDGAGVDAPQSEATALIADEALSTVQAVRKYLAREKTGKPIRDPAMRATAERVRQLDPAQHEELIDAVEAFDEFRCDYYQVHRALRDTGLPLERTDQSRMPVDAVPASSHAGNDAGAASNGTLLALTGGTLLAALVAPHHPEVLVAGPGALALGWSLRGHRAIRHSDEKVGRQSRAYRRAQAADRARIELVNRTTRAVLLGDTRATKRQLGRLDKRDPASADQVRHLIEARNQLVALAAGHQTDPATRPDLVRAAAKALAHLTTGVPRKRRLSIGELMAVRVSEDDRLYQLIRATAHPDSLKPSVEPNPIARAADSAVGAYTRGRLTHLNQSDLEFFSAVVDSYAQVHERYNTLLDAARATKTNLKRGAGLGEAADADAVPGLRTEPNDAGAASHSTVLLTGATATAIAVTAAHDPRLAVLTAGLLTASLAIRRATDYITHSRDTRCVTAERAAIEGHAVKAEFLAKKMEKAGDLEGAARVRALVAARARLEKAASAEGKDSPAARALSHLHEAAPKSHPPLRHADLLLHPRLAAHDLVSAAVLMKTTDPTLRAELQRALDYRDGNALFHREGISDALPFGDGEGMDRVSTEAVMSAAARSSAEAFEAYRRAFDDASETTPQDWTAAARVASLSPVEEEHFARALDKAEAIHHDYQLLDEAAGARSLVRHVLAEGETAEEVTRLADAYATVMGIKSFHFDQVTRDATNGVLGRVPTIRMMSLARALHAVMGDALFLQMLEPNRRAKIAEHLRYDAIDREQTPWMRLRASAKERGKYADKMKQRRLEIAKAQSEVLQAIGRLELPESSQAPTTLMRAAEDALENAKRLQQAHRQVREAIQDGKFDRSARSVKPVGEIAGDDTGAAGLIALLPVAASGAADLALTAAHVPPQVAAAAAITIAASLALRRVARYRKATAQGLLSAAENAAIRGDSAQAGRLLDRMKGKGDSEGEGEVIVRKLMQTRASLETIASEGGKGSPADRVLIHLQERVPASRRQLRLSDLLLDPGSEKNDTASAELVKLMVPDEALRAELQRALDFRSQNASGAEESVNDGVHADSQERESMDRLTAEAVMARACKSAVDAFEAHARLRRPGNDVIEVSGREWNDTRHVASLSETQRQQFAEVIDELMPIYHAYRLLEHDFAARDLVDQALARQGGVKADEVAQAYATVMRTMKGTHFARTTRELTSGVLGRSPEVQPLTPAQALHAVLGDEGLLRMLSPERRAQVADHLAHDADARTQTQWTWAGVSRLRGESLKRHRESIAEAQLEVHRHVEQIVTLSSAEIAMTSQAPVTQFMDAVAALNDARRLTDAHEIVRSAIEQGNFKRPEENAAPTAPQNTTPIDDPRSTAADPGVKLPRFLSQQGWPAALLTWAARNPVVREEVAREIKHLFGEERGAAWCEEKLAESLTPKSPSDLERLENFQQTLFLPFRENVLPWLEQHFPDLGPQELQERADTLLAPWKAQLEGAHDRLSDEGAAFVARAIHRLDVQGTEILLDGVMPITSPRPHYAIRPSKFPLPADLADITVEQIAQAIRGVTPQADRIADALTAADPKDRIILTIVDSDKEWNAAWGESPPENMKGFARGNQMWIRRESFSDWAGLGCLVHEGTHALDRLNLDRGEGPSESTDVQYATAAPMEARAYFAQFEFLRALGIRNRGTDASPALVDFGDWDAVSSMRELCNEFLWGRDYRPLEIRHAGFKEVDASENEQRAPFPDTELLQVRSPGKDPDRTSDSSRTGPASSSEPTVQGAPGNLPGADSGSLPSEAAAEQPAPSSGSGPDTAAPSEALQAAAGAEASRATPTPASRNNIGLRPGTATVKGRVLSNQEILEQPLKPGECWVVSKEPPSLTYDPSSQGINRRQTWASEDLNEAKAWATKGQRPLNVYRVQASPKGKKPILATDVKGMLRLVGGGRVIEATLNTGFGIDPQKVSAHESVIIPQEQWPHFRAAIQSGEFHDSETAIYVVQVPKRERGEPLSFDPTQVLARGKLSAGMAQPLWDQSVESEQSHRRHYSTNVHTVYEEFGEPAKGHELAMVLVRKKKADSGQAPTLKGRTSDYLPKGKPFTASHWSDGSHADKWLNDGGGRKYKQSPRGWAARVRVIRRGAEKEVRAWQGDRGVNAFGLTDAYVGLVNSMNRKPSRRDPLRYVSPPVSNLVGRAHVPVFDEASGLRIFDVHNHPNSFPGPNYLSMATFLERLKGNPTQLSYEMIPYRTSALGGLWTPYTHIDNLTLTSKYARAQDHRMMAEYERLRDGDDDLTAAVKARHPGVSDARAAELVQEMVDQIIPSLTGHEMLRTQDPSAAEAQLAEMMLRHPDVYVMGGELTMADGKEVKSQLDGRCNPANLMRYRDIGGMVTDPAQPLLNALMADQKAGLMTVVHADNGDMELGRDGRPIEAPGNGTKMARVMRIFAEVGAYDLSGVPRNERLTNDMVREIIERGPVRQPAPIIWAHLGGIGNWVRSSTNHLQMLNFMLRHPLMQHVYLDSSWLPALSAYNADPRFVTQMTALIETGRVLYGGDVTNFQTLEQLLGPYTLQQGLLRKLERNGVTLPSGEGALQGYVGGTARALFEGTKRQQDEFRARVWTSSEPHFVRVREGLSARETEKMRAWYQSYVEKPSTRAPQDFGKPDPSQTFGQVDASAARLPVNNTPARDAPAGLMDGNADPGAEHPYENLDRYLYDLYKGHVESGDPAGAPLQAGRYEELSGYAASARLVNSDYRTPDYGNIASDNKSVPIHKVRAFMHEEAYDAEGLREVSERRGQMAFDAALRKGLSGEEADRAREAATLNEEAIRTGLAFALGLGATKEIQLHAVEATNYVTRRQKDNDAHLDSRDKREKPLIKAGTALAIAGLVGMDALLVRQGLPSGLSAMALTIRALTTHLRTATQQTGRKLGEGPNEPGLNDEAWLRYHEEKLLSIGPQFGLDPKRFTGPDSLEQRFEAAHADLDYLLNEPLGVDPETGKQETQEERAFAIAAVSANQLTAFDREAGANIGGIEGTNPRALFGASMHTVAAMAYSVSTAASVVALTHAFGPHGVAWHEMYPLPLIVGNFMFSAHHTLGVVSGRFGRNYMALPGVQRAMNLVAWPSICLGAAGWTYASVNTGMAFLHAHMPMAGGLSLGQAAAAGLVTFATARLTHAGYRAEGVFSGFSPSPPMGISKNSWFGRHYQTALVAGVKVPRRTPLLNLAAAAGLTGMAVTMALGAPQAGTTPVGAQSSTGDTGSKVNSSFSSSATEFSRIGKLASEGRALESRSTPDAPATATQHKSKLVQLGGPHAGSFWEIAQNHLDDILSTKQQARIREAGGGTNSLITAATTRLIIANGFDPRLADGHPSSHHGDPDNPPRGWKVNVSILRS